MSKKLFIISTLVLLYYQHSTAQVSKDSELFKALKTKDSIFFEKGFNQCNLTYLEENVSHELRFYHDQGGYQGYEPFMQSVKENLCGNPNYKPIRKLQEGSLEVYPLYNNGELYGAIQHGVHHFYIREPGKPDFWTGTAKFTSVWLKQGNNWILSEVLSYDHHAPEH